MESVIGAIMPFFIFFMSVLAIIGILVYSYVMTERRRKQWSAFAAEQGLHHMGWSWFSAGQVYGDLDGYPVKLWVFTKGSGKNKSTWTGVATGIRPGLGLGLSIYREHMFSGLGKMLGFQDIQTGDKEFDDRFVIKGRNPEQVVAALGAEARGTILRYDDFVGGGKVQDDEVYWEVRGVTNDLNKVRTVWKAQRAVAQALVVGALARRSGL